MEEIAEIFGDNVAFPEHVGFSKQDAEQGPIETVKEEDPSHVEVEETKA